MLAAYGLGNVLGCDVNDLVCLEIACGAGMTVNPDASMRSVAPCVPQCGSGQQLNPSTLTCESSTDPQVANLLTPIDSAAASVAADVRSIFPGSGTASTGSAWKWILGGLAVIGIGVLAFRHHKTSTVAAPAAT